MPSHGTWTTRGFDDFSRGTCGNGGQNLYISRAGVLQRIHQYDLDRDGHFDIVFCNSQDHFERAPAYVLPSPLGDGRIVELPAEGTRDAVVADLNGNGCDDLVLAFDNNGIRFDLNAMIYFGSTLGLSERYQQHLPAPEATSVAAGDFRGRGRKDLVFVCGGKVRFFPQDEEGFDPEAFTDTDIEAEQVIAANFEDGGPAVLLAGDKDGRVHVYRGDNDGLDPQPAGELPWRVEMPAASELEKHTVEVAEKYYPPRPLVCVLHIDGRPHVFIPQRRCICLAPLPRDLQFGQAQKLDCRAARAAAVGDVNGNGKADLVIACQDADESDEKAERSWIYWGGDDGFSDARRTPMRTRQACDVAVGDLDASGCADIVFCQGHDDTNFTTESWIYRGGGDPSAAAPIAIKTHDAVRTLIARPAPDMRPHLIFANHFARNLIGNIPVYIYHGGADGYAPDRRTDLPGWGAVEAVCCDFNDDGHVDVALANCAENSVWLDPGSYVYLNGPNGFPSSPSAVLPTKRSHGVACADLNRNGYLDLILGGFDNSEITIFHGGADGFDAANPTRIDMQLDGRTLRETRWLYLADLNNDGWLDLVVPQVGGSQSLVMWGGPDGFSMQRVQVLRVRCAICARAADLTGNGYADLILGCLKTSEGRPHDSFVYIYWNGPDGLREDRRQMLPANHVNGMAVADFNNDGLLDLFICAYHDGRDRDIPSLIYWNRPGRGFSAGDFTRLHAHSTSGCIAGDFNEDGYVDLAVANHKTFGDHVGDSFIWWNSAEGFDSHNITRLPTMGPHGMRSVGPGNLLDRGPQEYYTSPGHELPAGHRVSHISWQAQVPAKTWINAQMRFADRASALADAPWLGAGGGDTWIENDCKVDAAMTTGRWVQYRLALGAINGLSTPRVSAVHLQHQSDD